MFDQITALVSSRLALDEQKRANDRAAQQVQKERGATAPRVHAPTPAEVQNKEGRASTGKGAVSSSPRL